MGENNVDSNGILMGIPIDAIEDPVCILDDTCTIIAVNASWRRFADENPPPPLHYCIGINYEELCSGIVGPEAGEARAIADGIRAVLEGSEERYTQEYACHAPGKERWFRVSVARYQHGGGIRLLVTHRDITHEHRIAALRQRERERSRRLQRDSNMKYRVMFESMKEGAFFQNADGRLEDVNGAALAILGVTREEFLGRTSQFAGWDVIAEDGTRLKPGEHPSMRALVSGRPVEGVIVGVWNPRSQSVKWVSASAIPFHREGSVQPAQVFVTIHDLTERKQWEDQLRYQATLLEQISDVVVATDMEGRITYVNDAMTVALARPKEELVGGTTALFGDDPSRGATQQQITERTVREGSWRGEVVNRSKDGRDVIQLVRTFVVRDEAGRPIGMCGVGTDITDLKTAEEALRRQEALYRGVVESSADGFAMLDMNAMIVEVNPTYCRLSGYSRDELLGSSLAMLEVNETQEEILEHMRSFAEAGSVLFDTYHRRKDGTVWQVQVNASYWPIGGGRCFAFYRDLVARNRSEVLLRARFRLAALATTAHPAALLQAALDEAELLTASTLGFIHTVREEQGLVTLQALSTNGVQWAGRSVGEDLDGASVPTGVWSDCLRMRTPVIANEMHTPVHGIGVPEGTFPIGRMLVVPLIRDGSIQVLMTVANKTTDYSDDDAAMVGSLASITMDLVGSARAEHRLQVSEERFRKLYEMSEEGILHTDPQSGRVLSANPAACRILGRPEERIIALGRSGLLDQSDPRWMQALGDRARHGHVDFEFRFLRGDGTPVEVSGSSSMYSLSDGSVRADIIFRDFTARKRTEETLRQLSAAIEFSPLSVVITDHQGTMQYVNPRFEQVTGYMKAEVLGRNPRILQSGNTPAPVYEDLWSAMRRGEMWHGEFQNKRKDGTLFWEEAWIAPIPAPGTDPGHIVGIKEEVTDRKRIAQVLAEQTSALGAFAAHLEEVREEERTSLAREVHDAFGQVLSAIKLDAIRLESPDMGDPEHTAKRISSILALADSGMKTVHEISARLRPGILDNLGLVAALEWQLEDFEKRTGIRCTSALPETEIDLGPEMATMFFRCSQAILTNVALHARARSVRFAFTASEEEFRMVVTDDGVGIEEPRIDDPLSYGLTGIRERVKLFGGTLQLRRLPEGGTEATIHVPLFTGNTVHD